MTSKIDASTLEMLETWIGRSEFSEDELHLGPVLGMAALVNLDPTHFKVGSVLPPLWHWLFFLSRHAQKNLGEDGHAESAGFLPPVPLPGRMWAGGRAHWVSENPLRIGDKVRRISSIKSVSHKFGRSGDLVFVVASHEYHNSQGLSLTEEFDIVFREVNKTDASSSIGTLAPSDATWAMKVVPDEVYLFRYSALTFNGHRVHYDRRYAVDVEGYPGLVVHGPLIATLLAELVRLNLPNSSLKEINFKAVRPTFSDTSFSVCASPIANSRQIKLWASDHDGFLTMDATASY